jgi:GNAT superfamily N-acetyltransferase
MEIREATAGDADYLLDMLVEACNWSGQRRVSRTAVEADHQLRSYVSGWPRDHDVGVVAIDDRASRIGAAWARTFTAAEPGYGYVGDDVPEISMAVDPRWRGQGVGRRLLRALIEMAQEGGWRAISLSVEDGNRARQLYLAAGFTTVGRSGTSETMVLDLQRDVLTSRCVRSQR